MIAAHADAHAMTDAELVAIVDDRAFGNRSDGENESLGRIDDRRKGINPEPTEVRNRESAALKFLRLHAFIARPVGQIFDRLADLAERFSLRSFEHRGDETVF